MDREKEGRELINPIVGITGAGQEASCYAADPGIDERAVSGGRRDAVTKDRERRTQV